MIASSVYSVLLADAGISALVGASVFPLTIPEGNLFPAMVYSIDQDDIDQLLAEVGSLRRALVSVDGYSTDHAQAHALADAVEAALIGKRGAFGTKTAEFITLERRFDLFESDTKLYRVSLQFLVAYY